jgi:hypothetical protein
VVTQLAREFGAYVIGTGRAADRQAALEWTNTPAGQPAVWAFGRGELV